MFKTFRNGNTCCELRWKRKSLRWADFLLFVGY